MVASISYYWYSIIVCEKLFLVNFAKFLLIKIRLLFDIGLPIWTFYEK